MTLPTALLALLLPWLRALLAPLVLLVGTIFAALFALLLPSLRASYQSEAITNAAVGEQ